MFQKIKEQNVLIKATFSLRESTCFGLRVFSLIKLYALSPLNVNLS